MPVVNRPGNASPKNLISQCHLARISFTTVYGAIFAVLALVSTSPARGQTRVLYSFTGSANGLAPAAGLVRDAAGNLYGTTPSGGNQLAVQCQTFNGCGVVFELVLNSDGTYTQTVIHTFEPGVDGINPRGDLLLDSAGNLYGTTEYGGKGCSNLYGCGTVYELSPTGTGSWSEAILYNFTSGIDGTYPEAGLIFDGAGNLYGTTGFGAGSGCNTLGCGTVFELTPNQDGSWTEQILYVFQDSTDGAEPGSPLVFDEAGNLFGTAAVGGNAACNPPYGCGTVYELSPGYGNWSQKTLYTFDCGADGCFPSTGLASDGFGNLFGNMAGAGANGHGYVYKLSRQTKGTFNFVTLHDFDLTDGGQPEGTLLFAGGSLYGATYFGGSVNQPCYAGCGGVFRLTPAGGHAGYTFVGFGKPYRGRGPEGTLIRDSDGILYGTSSTGGAHDDGAVFKVTAFGSAPAR